VIRALFSSALSFLLIVTLMWGGCISCPQFFMFPTVEKSCCRKSGQCERPAKNAPVKECKRMPLEPQGFTSAHAELAAAVLPVNSFYLLRVLTPARVVICTETPQVEHPPPDLNVLNSTFLI
jgi:hypothetical protein